MRAHLLPLLVVWLSIVTSAAGMRLVLQRVKTASVSVNEQTVSSIGRGVMALVGLHESDTASDLAY